MGAIYRIVARKSRRFAVLLGVILIIVGISLLVLLFPLGYSIEPLLMAIGTIMIVYGWRLSGKQRLRPVSVMK